MRHLALALFGAVALSLAAPVHAGPGVINQACRKSDKAEATPQLCSCIQKAASRSLNMIERRTVAKWFDDPHQAQVVRQSDDSGDEVLWERYKAFGELARQSCR